jgi:hypothetical protein
MMDENLLADKHKIVYNIRQLSSGIYFFQVTFKAKESAMDKDPNPEKKKTVGLSSAKREDIWALIIASVVMLIAFAAPEGVYRFFTEVLFLF